MSTIHYSLGVWDSAGERLWDSADEVSVLQYENDPVPPPGLLDRE